MNPYKRFHAIYTASRVHKELGKQLGACFYAPATLEYPLAISERIRVYSPEKKTKYKLRHVAYVYEDRIEFDTKNKEQSIFALRRLCKFLGAPEPYSGTDINKKWFGGGLKTSTYGSTAICYDDGTVEIKAQKIEHDIDKRREFRKHVAKVRELIAVRQNLGVFTHLKPECSWSYDRKEFLKMLAAAAEDNISALERLATPLYTDWYRTTATTPLEGFDRRLKQLRKLANRELGGSVVVEM